MSVADQITRLNTAKADIKTAIEAKGVTVPSTAKIDVYDDYIAQIQQGKDRSEYWTHDWKFKRPADWPDLDLFDVENNPNTMVMLYDCRDRIANPATNNDHFWVRCSNANSVIERYKVVNGELVLSWTHTTAGNEVVSHLLPTNEGNYVVYKLYTNSTWYRYFFTSSDAGRGEDGYMALIGTNKILEIQGNCPGFASAAYSWGSDILKRFKWYNTNSSRPMIIYQYFLAYSDIEHIEFGTTWYLFATQSYGFAYSKLRELDFDNFINTNGWNFGYIFAGCSLLENLHFGENMPTISQISGAFQHCGSLKSADFQNLPVPSTMTDYRYTFGGCRVIETIDISTWVFSSAVYLSQMFLECYKLQEVIFGDYSFGKVTQVANMFQYCFSLRRCSFSGRTIDFSKCTNFNYMFNQCYNLLEMDMSNWTCSFTASNTQVMFDSCYALTKVVFPASTTGMQNNILRYCCNLKTIIVNATTPPTYALTASLAEQWNPNYKIYVPTESVNSYKAASGWANAADHIYDIAEYSE